MVNINFRAVASVEVEVSVCQLQATSRRAQKNQRRWTVAREKGVRLVIHALLRVITNTTLPQAAPYLQWKPLRVLRLGNR